MQDQHYDCTHSTPFISAAWFSGCSCIHKGRSTHVNTSRWSMPHPSTPLPLHAKEYLAGGESTASTATAALNMADFLADSELQQLHSDRIAQLQEEAEKRTQLAQKGHGIYSEITEGVYLPLQLPDLTAPEHQTLPVNVVLGCWLILFHFFKAN